MGTFNMTMPEQSEMQAGGKFLKTPGIYHLLITEVDERPIDKSGAAVDGFKVKFDVLGGPEAGKESDAMFFSPKSGDLKDAEGKKNWALYKRAALFIATGQAVYGEKSASIELQDAVDRQVVAEFQYDERDKDKPENQKFLQLHFANIYHVDDPAGAKAVKDEKSLKLLPASLRRSPEYFKPAQANGHAPKSQPAANDDLGDI